MSSILLDSGALISAIILRMPYREVIRIAFAVTKSVACAGDAVDISFCGHAILGDDLFVVEDATRIQAADTAGIRGSPHTALCGQPAADWEVSTS